MPNFCVVDAETGAVLTMNRSKHHRTMPMTNSASLDDYIRNNCYVYTTGSLANERAQVATTKFGTKFIPRIIPDKKWRIREECRLQDGEYIPLPDFILNALWWLENKHTHNDHFVHVSTEKSDMIAYTPDEKSGEQDKQTRTTMGRYLTKYFSEILDGQQIGDIAARYAAANEKTCCNLRQRPKRLNVSTVAVQVHA